MIHRALFCGPVVALVLASIPVTSATSEVNHDPCTTEWHRLGEISKSNDEMIRGWVALSEKCANSGLYEARVALLYGVGNQWGDARKAVEAGLALKTDYGKELTSTLANVEMAEGKLDASLRRYESLIKQYPQFADGYSGAGAVKIAQHKYADALPFLVAAKNYGPSADIYRNLIIANTQIGHYDEAVAAIKDGYAFDKSIAENKEAMHGAAIAYAHLGNFKLAEGMLKMLFQAHPDAAHDPEIAKTFRYIKKSLNSDREQSAQ